jgi:hypothetical protein
MTFTVKLRWLMVLLLGLWVVADGAGSIIVYWGQSPLEHLVRLLRISAGLALIYLSVGRALRR